MNQNKKNANISFVVILAESGRPFGMLLMLGHIALSITNMHVPPMLACTPYQIHAMTPRLNVHHKLPYNPKDVLATTGNVICRILPGRAFITRNGLTTPYPIQTQIQACHQDSPAWIIEDAIIQVLTLKLSAIQKAKKLRCFHVLFSMGTGSKSSVIRNMSE
jgi:hypothetical protein